MLETAGEQQNDAHVTNKRDRLFVTVPFLVCAPWARSNAMSLTLEYFLQKSKFLMMVRKMIVRKRYFLACKIGRNILPACCRYVLVELRQSIIKTHNRTIFLLASDCFSVWTNRCQIFRQKIFDCFAANLSLDK